MNNTFQHVPGLFDKNKVFFNELLQHVFGFINDIYVS